MRVRGSYRDPSGHVFTNEGAIYRQVNLSYQEHYDFLMDSGLYDDLASLGLMVRHQVVGHGAEESSDVYKILKPEPVPFISYPYEWSFSQLKDAALTTLQIQSRALEFGMTLKDSSAYNIQFLHGKPVLIDTLSFQTYREGDPWVAYKQFCQHFLAPLALASYGHIGTSRLLQVFIDGFPLGLAHSLLPFRTRFRPSMQIHIHMHSRFQDKFANRTDAKNRREGSFKRNAFLGLLDSLRSAVQSLSWHPGKTEWLDYYEDEPYAKAASDHKARLLTGFLEEVKPHSVWDFGSNTGHFSRIASDMGIQTVAFDQDPAAVEENYKTSVNRNEANLLPLVLDLAVPSPKIGWANSERMDLVERGPADMLFALALVHHLAISGNVPLEMIAEFFGKLCNWAVIEFVPKEDGQLQRLLATREDVFPSYTQEHFESEFSRFFEIKSVHRIVESQRTLYLMRVRQSR